MSSVILLQETTHTSWDPIIKKGVPFNLRSYEQEKVRHCFPCDNSNINVSLEPTAQSFPADLIFLKSLSLFHEPFQNLSHLVVRITSKAHKTS